MARVVPDPMLEPTITVADAAKILGVGLRTAYNVIERGELPSIRVGRAIRVPTAKFIAKYGLEPTAREPEPLPAA